MGVGCEGGLPIKSFVIVESNLKKRGLFSIGQKMAAEQKRKENVNKGRPLYMYIFEFISCQHSQTKMEFDALYS